LLIEKKEGIYKIGESNNEISINSFK